MIINFTIKGNQLDHIGNPMPYLRMTRGQKWTDKARKYEDWKQYVRNAFIASIGNVDNFKKAIDKVLALDIINPKPLVLLSKEARMDIKITYANEHHGDPDNIFKGIADALFYDDKHLAGSFEFEHGKEGKVEVNILI